MSLRDVFIEPYTGHLNFLLLLPRLFNPKARANLNLSKPIKRPKTTSSIVLTLQASVTKPGHKARLVWGRLYVFPPSDYPRILKRRRRNHTGDT